MNKKFYMAPESEELMLEIEAAILADSGVTDPEPGEEVPILPPSGGESDGI